MTTATGWLSVDDEYDGQDNFIETVAELYENGRDLGKWQSVIDLLRTFDGQRVRITVEPVDA